MRKRRNMRGRSPAAQTTPASGPHKKDMRRARSRRKKALIAVAALALVGVVVNFIPTLFVKTVSGDALAELRYDVIRGNRFTSFSVSRDAYDVTAIVWSLEGDTLNVDVRAKRRPLLSKPYARTTVLPDTYYSTADIARVTLGGRLVIWENGTAIDSLAACMFFCATPHAAAVENSDDIVKLLKVGDAFSSGARFFGWFKEADASFTSEIYNDAGENVWKIRYHDDAFAVSASYLDLQNREKRILPELGAASCILLAIVGDLDAVDWNYFVDGEERFFRFTAQDATQALGKDVKLYGASATDVQKLLNKINYSKNGRSFIDRPYFAENEE